MQFKQSFPALAMAVMMGIAGASAVKAGDQAKPHSAPAAAAAKPKASPQAPTPAVSLPELSAQQVVERYVSARGGAAAWKAVNSLQMTGKMGAGGTTYEAVTKKLTLERKEREEMQLPFVLQSKRPYKLRLELTFNGQTAVQVFDGAHGYRYRPYLNRTDWEPYTAEELKVAMAEPGIDGWLIDYAAKGTRVASAGTEMVEGQPAYRLAVTRKDGQVRKVWIDGKSFLELKEDGEPRKLDGRSHPVTLYLRDYRRDQALMIPHVLETAVQGVTKTEKIMIDSVTVNPPLDDSRFTKPK
jgi:outer membrane lipoprotein-sorting protein